MMKRALWMPVLLLSAPAWAKVEPIAPERAYVEGRLAASAERFDIASARFATVLEAGDDNQQLTRQALDIAMMGGNAAETRRLANSLTLPSSDNPSPAVRVADSMVALARIATAAGAGDWKAVDAARAHFVAPAAAGESNPVFGRLMAAWSAAARRDWDTALAEVDPTDASGASHSYLLEHRAHILGMAQRWPEAADAYAILLAGEGADVANIRIAAAAAALEAGRRDPAWREKGIAILAGGPAEDPLLDLARARIHDNPNMRGRALGGLVTSASEGLGRLLLRAGVDIARKGGGAPALGFTRLASFAAPPLPDVWLISAEFLVRADQPTQALAALDELAKAGPPYTHIATVRRAGILGNQEKYDEATRLLAGLANRNDADSDDWSRLADMQRRAKNFAASAEHFSRAIALLPESASPAQQAQLWFLRGSVHEQAGNWEMAEPDLRRAVELDPENPIYLNYLGYSLLDRRVNLPESRDLIARAYAVAPDNGAIIDSMGWAAYIAGNYAEAVKLLERARAAEPADPTVADHLGDVYWRLGRRMEARYAWASAAELDPPERVRKLLELKRLYGLDVAHAAQ